MKDWLTLIIVVLILGIVLDGLRRMRAARRESLRLSKNAIKADQDKDMRVSSSEFPSGGARVAAVREKEDAENLNENVRKSYVAGRVTLGASQRFPEQVSLNLEESVPMLMDSVEEESEEESETEEDFFADDQREPELGSLEFEDDEISKPRSASEQPQDKEEVASQTLSKEKDGSSSSTQNDYKTKSSKNKTERKQTEADEFVEPDEVLIINVMARQGERFHGTDLLNALMGQGLRFGDMDIFHRHKNNDGDGPIIFSLANMVVPGTFNLAEMDNFETPGISMFLSLPVSGESLSAYNDLATTAKNLASSLNGELKDENRSVMTSQTIEHGRQRVIEYERKKKLAHA